jgi:hypothetical protein
MKKLLLLIIILHMGFLCAAQSLAVNTTGATANASAILDVSTTNKGILIPRMSKAQKNAIATPATGLLIVQNGCGWQQVIV